MLATVAAGQNLRKLGRHPDLSPSAAVDPDISADYTQQHILVRQNAQKAAQLACSSASVMQPVRHVVAKAIASRVATLRYPALCSHYTTKLYFVGRNGCCVWQRH